MTQRMVLGVAVLVAVAALGERPGAQAGAERIAFTWCYADYGWSDGGVVCRIIAMDPDAPAGVFNDDGSPAGWQPLTEGAMPAWSPDGTRIAFTGTHAAGGAGVGEVAVLNLANGTLGDPASRPTWAYWAPSPAWSPDGSKIAFASDRDGAFELYVMNADGSGVTRLTHDVGFQGGPAWSPDGTRISFNCTVEPGNWDVCAIDADGAHVTRLTTDPGADAGASWSPTGRIAFATTRYGAELYGGRWPPEIALMNGDGSGVTRLGVVGVGPVWSPDGSRIAFGDAGGACEDFCNGGISVMNADGSNVRGLTGGFHPSWTRVPLPRVLAPPVASSPDLNYWGCDGRTCTFGAWPSWDDASPWWDPSAIASYHWDFGDGTTGSGLVVDHTYAAYGTYTTTLTVTDHDGLVGTERRTLNVIQWW